MFLKGNFWIIKIHDLHKFQHVFPMIILFDIKPLNKLVKDGIFLSSSLNLIYPLVAIYYANGWYDTSKKKQQTIDISIYARNCLKIIISLCKKQIQWPNTQIFVKKDNKSFLYALNLVFWVLKINIFLNLDLFNSC